MEHLLRVDPEGLGMRILSKKYDEISEKGRWTRMWLEEKDATMREQVRKLPHVSASAAVVGVFIVGFSLIGLLNVAFSKDGSFHWSPIGWLFVGTLVVGALLALIDSVRVDNNDKKRRVAKRTELQAELDADPLYVRAKLIVQAVDDYFTHCAKYRAWFDAVQEGLAARDVELAERYYAFIERAHGVLTKAVANFQSATAFVKRQKVFRETHPQLNAKPNSTALSDLIAQLDKPVEMPPDVALTDPSASLEYETSLAEVSRDFEDRELIERIDAAVARAALPAKTG